MTEECLEVWGVLFSSILVGLPAAAGAYELAADMDRRRRRPGAGLLVYAAVLASVFAYYFPWGKLSDTPYAIVMPSVLSIGFILGGLAGLARRRRDSSR